MAKKTETQKLVKKLDDIIRLILKKKYPSVCCTCGKHTSWVSGTNRQGLQVGHFISRRYKAIRWNLKNVHPQCASCNFLHMSNPVPYTNFMLKEYGQPTIDALNELANKNGVTKFRVNDLRVMLEELERHYNAL